jgi:hypothetical protein
MRRAPKQIAFAILASIWAAGAVGCVTIPVPPVDTGKYQAGDFGTLVVRLVAEYKPNFQGLVTALSRPQPTNKTVVPAK